MWKGGGGTLGRGDARMLRLLLWAHVKTLCGLWAAMGGLEGTWPSLYSPAELLHCPQKRQELRDRTTPVNLFRFLKGSFSFIRKQLSEEGKFPQ